MVTAFVLLSACSGGGNVTSESRPPEPGELTISFDYERVSGRASNQFAVWIEDMDGNFVTTLYATRWTANGGYRNRPDSIHRWVDASGLASMSQAEVDAISGATPGTGAVSYAWDLSDRNGNAVAAGQYRFFVEGSLRWRNSVVYSGVVDIGGGDITVNGEAEFFFVASGNNPALYEDASENNMITAVTATWKP